MDGDGDALEALADADGLGVSERDKLALPLRDPVALPDAPPPRDDDGDGDALEALPDMDGEGDALEALADADGLRVRERDKLHDPDALALWAQTRPLPTHSSASESPSRRRLLLPISAARRARQRRKLARSSPREHI